MRLMALAIAAILMQNPSVSNPDGDLATIQGTVMGINGPLARAEVAVLAYPLPVNYQPALLPRAMTSSDGRFSIQVPPGAYRITARAAGYVTQTYGAIQSGANEQPAGTVIQLGAHQSKELKIALTAEGILSGRVTATDGRPLLRIEVAALQKRFSATGTSFQVRGIAQTDDRGEYRIGGLSPGSYVVSASGLNPLRVAYEAFVASRTNSAAPSMPSPGNYGAVYYPAADHSSRASIIEIRPGNETRNIDFLLAKQRGYAIRGNVIRPSGELTGPVPAISIRPAYAEYSTELISVGDAYKPDGSFELTGVSPGFYWVMANVPAALTAEQRTLLSTTGADLSQLPRPTRGVALVHVIDGDVDNVKLTMVRDLELLGQLSVNGEEFDFSGKLKDFKLELRPTDPLSNGAPNSFSSLEPGGEFVYRRLLPTEYRLTVSSLPAPFYVKEARYGTVDLLADTLLLTSPATTRLHIALSRGSEVRGKLTGAGATPVENCKVVLIPEGMPQRYDRYRTAVTNAAGAFALHGVAPGTYKALAWRTIEEFQYFDEGFVAQFQNNATSVRVGESGEAIEIEMSLIQ